MKKKDDENDDFYGNCHIDLTVTIYVQMDL